MHNNLVRQFPIINLKNKGKRLILIGTQHTFDTLSPALTLIQKALTELRPETVINAGGDR